MIKIKGTKTYIDVYIDDKIARIKGEMIVGGFIAFKDSIIAWRVPEGVLITDKEKRDIINEVIEKTQNSHFVITFE